MGETKAYAYNGGKRQREQRQMPGRNPDFEVCLQVKQITQIDSPIVFSYYCYYKHMKYGYTRLNPDFYSDNSAC